MPRKQRDSTVSRGVETIFIQSTLSFFPMKILLFMLNGALAGVTPTAEDFVQPPHTEYVIVSWGSHLVPERLEFVNEQTLWDVIERASGGSGIEAQSVLISRKGDGEMEKEELQYRFSDVPSGQRVDYLKQVIITAGDHIEFRDVQLAWPVESTVSPGPGKIGVYGQIHKGGMLPWGEPTALEEVVDACGGLSRIWGSTVYITRYISPTHRVRLTYHRQKDETVGEFLQRVQVLPGDVLYFEEILC